MLASHFQSLATYNGIANCRLYEACRALSSEEYYKPRDGSFRSIHKTLNHILLGDRIWMARFTNTGGAATPPLDTILCESFDDLCAARSLEDIRIETFTQGLTNEAFDRGIEYVNNAGIRQNDPIGLLLAHLFNHQTHHRAQVHTMLSATPIAPPSLDLHRIIRPSPAR